MIVVQETRGEPDGLIVCHLPLGPTAFFTLSNCVLRHDIADRGTVSEVYPHLIFDKFTTTLGQRVADVLKYLFPVPKVRYMSEGFLCRKRLQALTWSPSGRIRRGIFLDIFTLHRHSWVVSVHRTGDFAPLAKRRFLVLTGIKG